MNDLFDNRQEESEILKSKDNIHSPTPKLGKLSDERFPKPSPQVEEEICPTFVQLQEEAPSSQISTGTFS